MVQSFILREATRLDLDDVIDVFRRAWRETYAEMLPERLLSPDSQVFSLGVWEKAYHRPRTSTFLVEEVREGRLAGFARCGPVRGSAVPGMTGSSEIQALYVLAEYQGRGAGRMLMRAMGQRLREEGFRSAMCWVLADNGRARGFYERMGGQAGPDRMLNFGGTNLPEVSYQWPSLELLDAAKA
jgi:ribosomal protein S18 acetylase RimI-like enzyme